MSFEHYYSTPFSSYVLNALLWAGIMAVVLAIVVCAAMLFDSKFNRRDFAGGVVAGLLLGGIGGVIFAGSGEQDINASILQTNIQKKYDVQAITFDFTTSRGGGHGWTPTQSDPQQVIVKVNNVSKVATLTQNEKTAEPTLVDIDTNQEIALHEDVSQ